MAKRNFEFVNAVVIDKSGRVLLEKRSDVPIWALPGGEIERGESPETAVIREVKEETGLDVKIKQCIGSYHNAYFNYRDVTRVFLCRINGGRMKANYESLELRFFPASSLPKLLLFIYRARIMDAISGCKNVDRVQRISLWKVVANLRFSPFMLFRLVIVSFRKVFSF